MTIYFPNTCLLPEIAKGKQLSDFFIQIFIESGEHFQIIHQYVDSFRLLLPNNIEKNCNVSNTKVTLVNKYKRSIHYTDVLIKSFEILLLPDFEKYLHRISVVVHFGISREIFLNLVPFTGMYFFLKVPHIEVKARFLLKPTKYRFQS